MIVWRPAATCSGDGGSVLGRLLSYGGVLVFVVLLVTAVVALLVQPRSGSIDPDEFTRLAQEAGTPPPDQRAQIEVLNGCGVSGIAARVHDFLRERSYDVVNVENARSFDYAETLIIDRGGDERIARDVARALGTENVIRQVRPDLLLEVTVILGRDYRSLQPYRDITP